MNTDVRFEFHKKTALFMDEYCKNVPPQQRVPCQLLDKPGAILDLNKDMASRHFLANHKYFCQCVGHSYSTAAHALYSMQYDGVNTHLLSRAIFVL